MDFVGVMLFTQQIFHSECFAFFWLLLILEIVNIYQIKSRIGVTYKSVAYKKAYNAVF